MRIKTRLFSLNQEQFFRLMLIDLASRWWGYGLIAVGLLIYAIASGRNVGAIIGIVVVFALLVAVMVWRVRQSVMSPENKPFFQPRRMEADLSSLYFYTQDGRLDQVPYTNINRVLRRQEYYLFYVGTNFYYVPYSAFIAPEDMGAFESALKRAKLIK